MFSNLLESIAEHGSQWAAVMDSATAENLVPEVGSTDRGRQDSEIVREMKKMAVLKILRPDRFIAMVRLFVTRTLGDLSSGDLDLMRIVEKESNAKSPLLLVSAPGFDASYKVDMLAKQASKKYASVAIGSPEAFGLVD